jgi:hypothetical protein
LVRGCGLVSKNRFDLDTRAIDNKLATEEKEIRASILSDIVGLKLYEVTRMDINETDTTRLLKNFFKSPRVVTRWEMPAIRSKSGREWA